MEFRHLRYFVAVAEELHFTRAAERLHMAQQPLSIQIQRLEDELGVTLFDRTTRHVALTEAGRLFLQKARDILNLADDAVESARRLQRQTQHRLTLGYVNTALQSAIPRVLATFQANFPDAELSLEERHSPELDSLVLRGTVDLGLIATPMIAGSVRASNPGLAYLLLHREPVLVALPVSHPLSRERDIPLAALSGVPFVQYSATEKAYVQQMIADYFQANGLSLNTVQEAATEHAIVGLVAAGVGVSLLSGALADLYPLQVSYRRLIEPQIDVEYGLIWRRESPPPLVESLVSILERRLFVGIAAD